MSQEQWDVSSGVGVTALMVAAARALESARDARLIDDPYAAALARAAGAAVPTAESDFDPRFRDAVDYIGLRSRYFDDFFVQAGTEQAVVLASGLDTRAFRLPWPPGVRVFEIDQPKVLAYKDEVLAAEHARPNCTRHAIGADLRDDWPAALREAGFDPALRTAWLAEGLLPYLDAATEQRLLREVTGNSAPGSRIAVEHLVTKQLLDEESVSASQSWGVGLDEIFSHENRPAPDVLLAELGWAVECDELATVAQRYGRELNSTARGLTEVGTLLTAELPAGRT
ncbi:SAM-dependent methyltransferase [Saccharopolyspora sp. WRP15-2]|uniref:S-adenosyl-L-methionine-dependent methyltransferase n=1 Tax=Saccharopolyspora oryzae TaxID=2997343 RepID=A0ABT4UXH1_9PSEU|nr:SAM-dependent methyltransferase [Saccharopolyspora oryzae]MDA3626412.1 SAM-dependent methyltransferase [Saccharopolyspora oryzae]